MRYPSPVPTQRADYKSAEAKAIALWSRERDGLAYHHRIERNRVYLTACIVSHVCCVFCLQWGGGKDRVVQLIKRSAQATVGGCCIDCISTRIEPAIPKRKKSWIEIRTSRAQPKLFMGGENFPFFYFYGSGIDFLWYPKRLGLSVLIWNLCKTDPTLFFGIWHITRRWHFAKIWTCTRRNWGYPRGSYISSPSLISRRLIFRTAPLHCENLLLAKGKWEILFTSQSLSVWIFFSFLLAESLASLWNVNASLTRPFPTQTLFDFWHSTCHENGTSIQSFDYWSSCPEFPSISNILLILKRRKRRDEHCRFIFLSMWRGGKQ